ncbi:Extracellular solute-binding protein family 3 [Pseudodesulfovibrio profundus]|uniref:Extracellular solute-binding protein family 3 n=1 Tax=Pseudodesulfovibrio profundus TaxID=57320 RepID=A0A2C8F8U4_9BACT|nr:ABC transporter substrate-binding protein [Pseudodesulfovibrio profundus]MBC16693.1 ABC transporter substrate-binding protein [Desulfovibrio sp.]SOB58282.1 Extracellular solute-binding protein family 3 [Pseudodesulfovibrio profundus]|tara:strand:+ start:34985 stop:35770 length:786 start_codon:yes stop_codon:yes gene_type:complete
MKKAIRMLAVLAVTVCIFALAGCSDEEVDSLTRVKDKGEISFAMSGGYPPFNFYNDSNELVGFDVDVAREVATRIGVELKPVTTEWSGIIEGLRSGAYDGILGSMAVTEQRLEVVNFSTPYYYSGAQMIIKKGSPYTAPADLKGKTIGVVTGTTFAKDAEKLGAGDIKLYKDDTHTLTELDSGVVDGVITDRVVGVNAKNSGKFDISLLGMPLRGEDIAVAFRQGDDTLLQEVNKVLNAMHEDGTLSEFSRKWLNTDVTVK